MLLWILREGVPSLAVALAIGALMFAANVSSPDRWLIGAMYVVLVFSVQLPFYAAHSARRQRAKGAANRVRELGDGVLP